MCSSPRIVMTHEHGAVQLASFLLTLWPHTDCRHVVQSPTCGVGLPVVDCVLVDLLLLLGCLRSF